MSTLCRAGQKGQGNVWQRNGRTKEPSVLFPCQSHFCFLLSAFIILVLRLIPLTIIPLTHFYEKAEHA